MLDKPEEKIVDEPSQSRNRRPRRQKSATFGKEMKSAAQRKAEIDERKKQRENAEQDWKQKRDDREKYRKAMAKAKKPGRDGQRKLGRESKVLLDRVKKVMGGN